MAGRAGEAMTRSEERMNVGTTTEQAGRARLRKYVVTEDVQQSVPVSREKVRVEREPVTEANRDAAMSGPDISEAEHEVTLHEERPWWRRKRCRSSGPAGQGAHFRRGDGRRRSPQGAHRDRRRHRLWALNPPGWKAVMAQDFL
jgi:uncharacterized protein (TIGR02271 family)